MTQVIQTEQFRKFLIAILVVLFVVITGGALFRLAKKNYFSATPETQLQALSESAQPVTVPADERLKVLDSENVHKEFSSESQIEQRDFLSQY